MDIHQQEIIDVYYTNLQIKLFPPFLILQAPDNHKQKRQIWM